MSASVATFSTPMRALKSSLALRATPLVPPATQAYEPLIKNILQQRLLRRMFLYSAVFCWAITVLVSATRQRGTEKLGLLGVLLSPMSPRTLGLSCIVWLFGVVPVLVTRKTYLTATPTAASSPSKVFQAALSKASTVRLLAAYTFSATVLTLVHVVTSATLEGSEARLSLFVKSKKHPYYLNGRLLFLASAQMFLAALCVLRNIMMDRLCARWTGFMSVRDKTETPSFMLARVVTVALSAILLTVIGTVAHLFLFGITRSAVLPLLFKVPFLSRLLRPFLAHFLRGSFSLALLTKNSGLIFRAFGFGFVNVAIWDFAESLFDLFVVEPIDVALSTADPAVTIVSGISSSDPYYKHFAFAELYHFANDDSQAGSARRAALFTDQKYNPSLWATLVREVLLALGNDYQLLLRRGAPPVAAPPPVEPAKKIDAPPQVPKAAFIHTSVLKPGRSSPLYSAFDTIASDGSITAAVTSTAEAGVSQIPELFRSVMPSQTAAVKETAEAAVETVKKGEQEIMNLVALPNKWKTTVREEFVRKSPKAVLDLAGRLEKWWHKERIYKVVEASLPYRKMDGLAADALCSLVCVSLAEDPYGVVQRDIPRILEALLSFLSAVEEYQSDIATQHPLPSQEEISNLSPKEIMEKQELALDIARANDALSEISDPLKDGVVKIVRTFGDKLSAFKFPSRTAKKLQSFVDYN